MKKSMCYDGSGRLRVDHSEDIQGVKRQGICQLRLQVLVVWLYANLDSTRIYNVYAYTS